MEDRYDREIPGKEVMVGVRGAVTRVEDRVLLLHLGWWGADLNLDLWSGGIGHLSQWLGELHLGHGGGGGREPRP